MIEERRARARLLSIERVTTNQSFVIMRAPIHTGRCERGGWRTLAIRETPARMNPGLQSAPVYPSVPEGFHPPYFNYTMNYTNP